MKLNFNSIFFKKYFAYGAVSILTITLLSHTLMRNPGGLPPSDPDNGGITLPGGFEAVGENFEHCMAMIGSEVVGQMNDALGSQFSIISEFLKEITNPLALFRQMFSMMRGFVLSFTTKTLGKASGPLSMFVYYLNKIQDLVRRMVGEGYIAAFIGVTAVSFIEGFVSLCLAIIKGFVYAMLIIAVILALFQPEILAIVLVLASSLAAAGA